MSVIFESKSYTFVLSSPGCCCWLAAAKWQRLIIFHYFVLQMAAEKSLNTRATSIIAVTLESIQYIYSNIDVDFKMEVVLAKTKKQVHFCLVCFLPPQRRPSSSCRISLFVAKLVWLIFQTDHDISFDLSTTGKRSVIENLSKLKRWLIILIE